MTSGLRNRLVIQRLSQVSSGAGAYTDTWTTVSTVWASVQDDTGRGDTEKYQYGNKGQEVTGPVVTLRKYTYDAFSVDKKDTRFLFGGAVLHMKSDIDPSNRGTMMRISCRWEEDN